MVEAEFAQIWQQLTSEAAKEEDPAAALAEIEAEKDDYRKIAERRVRLGLVLAEIGRVNNVQVTEQELVEAIRQEANRALGKTQRIARIEVVDELPRSPIGKVLKSGGSPGYEGLLFYLLTAPAKTPPAP